MTLANHLGDLAGVSSEDFGLFLRLLSPFVPHLAEELWEKSGRSGRAAQQPWPVYDPAKLVETEVTIVAQVNGKLRAQLRVAVDISEKAMEELALADEKVRPFVAGKTIRKVIVIKGRLVNIVVG
jgi:leucyl-tRNA synthetase